jgi:hypothetical protein
VTATDAIEGDYTSGDYTSGWRTSSSAMPTGIAGHANSASPVSPILG